MMTPEDMRKRDAELCAKIEQLRAALEPFARNADAVSLFEALGHIKREHLHDARAALELKNR